MLDKTPIHIPMQPDANLSKSMAPTDPADIEAMKKIPYRQAIGTLMFAICTRPEITYALNQVSRFSSNPGMQHWKAVQQIFRYLKGHPTSKLVYKKCDDPVMKITNQCELWCDASYGDDVDTRKSTSGFAIFLNGGLISFASRKQTIVAQSTTESEYTCLATATSDLLWLHNLLTEVDVPFTKPSVIHEDNQSTIHLANNQSL